MSGGEGATHLHDEPAAAAGEAGREFLAGAVADAGGRHDVFPEFDPRNLFLECFKTEKCARGRRGYYAELERH